MLRRQGCPVARYPLNEDASGAKLQDTTRFTTWPTSALASLWPDNLVARRGLTCLFGPPDSRHLVAAWPRHPRLPSVHLRQERWSQERAAILCKSAAQQPSSANTAEDTYLIVAQPTSWSCKRASTMRRQRYPGSTQEHLCVELGLKQAPLRRDDVQKPCRSRAMPL